MQMKSPAALLILSLVAGPCSASSVSELPIQRVVKLIAGLKAKAETDGKNEQKAFDTYACWCEDTLERKSSDISNAKDLVSETETLIKKLKGEIASHGAEIVQLNKDIAQNAASAKDATAMRDKEYKEYFNEQADNLNCVGALDLAIKVLSGAGTKKGFLDTTSHQVQLLSIAGGVQRVLRLSHLPKSVSSDDLELVKNFVAKPMEFFHSGMVAAQVGHNPFGDYAPQSDKIQGILKGMHDAFNADLAKDKAAEAESLKSFEALMETKKEEKATLVATLRKQETDHAEKTKKLSESEVLLDDTVTQLDADAAFFADTKEACQAKATEWSVRTRLRTEELNGMATAIKILSSGSAKKTFDASANTFLQLSSANKHGTASMRAAKAYDQLRMLAARYKSIAVAKVALLAQSGGHFDKVIQQIDMMVKDLRAEEQEDIAHRDLCENQVNANNNEIADLESSIEKTNKALGRMQNTQKELEGEISALDADIKESKKNMAELLKMRNQDVKDFKQALSDDADAIALMKQAIGALTKFYKDNNLALELAQRAPEYAKDPDVAPEIFSGDYGGKKSESTGILAILAMLVEDAEKEMTEGRADDADAQAKYEKQNGALQKTLDAQEETKANTEGEKGDLEAKMAAYEKFKNGKTGDKDAEGDTQKALTTGCAWVKTHFDTRRTKRKAEIDGLVDAKAFLSGSAELA